MVYHVNFMGKDLGRFSLDELRRRRGVGELTGKELVWCPGMETWQNLDFALATTAPKKKKPHALLIVGVVLGCLTLIGAVVLGTVFAKAFVAGYRHARQFSTSSRRADAFDKASQTIALNTNTATQADVFKKRKAFYTRQYIDGYRDRGRHNPASDAAAIRFLELWIESSTSQNPSATAAELAKMAAALEADPTCTDPVVLTAIATCSEEYIEEIHRFERAVKSFESSKHRAYPQLFATVSLANKLTQPADQARVGQLESQALDLIKKVLEDGSIQPEDQEHVAEVFLNGWGETLFDRKGTVITLCVKEKEESFKWLSLLLDGECEIKQAWKARGSGYANSVTSEGWSGFETHREKARESLTAAWELRPDLPQAARRMETVALGDDAASLRKWFDRAVWAQIDDPGAWHGMLWGLRPRWHGSMQAMKALGIAAIDTGRFDTDVPWKFFDVVRDLEADRNVSPGQHIYGDDDLWPQFQRMYDGYIAAPTQARRVGAWRTSYAIVAYFAGKYDVSRTQLEALNWELDPGCRANWGADISLLPLEVAARTGSLGQEISQAEANRDGDISKALADYKKLADSPSADERTRRFIQHRVASLQIEERLQKGEWVNWLPAATNDLNWITARGRYTVLPDGAVEVESGPTGHSLICRARVGVDFEVSGEIEFVHSTNKSFQAGLVMGLPEPDNDDWYSFRLKRNENEGQVVALSRGWYVGGQVRQKPINEDRNSFTFRFENTESTATVNGSKVLQRVKRPGNIQVSNDQFLVGLGAYNDSNETVVRYRNVKVRRITPGTSASKK